MPKRLDGLSGKRFEDIVNFMREIDEVGFTNELDNSRVMRCLNEKIDEIWQQVERKGSYYITTETRSHPTHASELVVTLHSTIKEAIQTNLILFVRPERNSIAISRDVIEEALLVGKGDIPYSGITVGFEEAYRLFKEKNRYNESSIAAFQAVYIAISQQAIGLECLLKISPLATGLDVKYLVGGKKMSSVRYEYNR